MEEDENNQHPSPYVLDDETNDDSHKTAPTPVKEITLPAKRQIAPKKVLKEDDSDFEVIERDHEDKKKHEEAVEESSDQDDFVQRT